MRDRLVELIAEGRELCEQIPCEGCTRSCKGLNDCVAKVQADHLLKNGVIAPPCKVGDTVYRTYGNFRGEKIYEGFVDQIRVSKNGEMRFYVYGHPLGFSLDDVGKNVFLTREEAERALKGEHHAEIH